MKNVFERIKKEDLEKFIGLTLVDIVKDCVNVIDFKFSNGEILSVEANGSHCELLRKIVI